MVGVAAFGVGVLMRPSAPSTVAEQVLAAPDVRTVSGSLGGGTATVMFSRDRNAGVLVMNNVPPPSPGTVYQMWLIDAKGPTSAGTMDTAAVAPSTKATLDHLGASTSAGVHRRTRHRFAAADREDIGRVVTNLTYLRTLPTIAASTPNATSATASDQGIVEPLMQAEFGVARPSPRRSVGHRRWSH